MLVFAYDGTLNGDWLAHYAVRFALSQPQRALRLVHVAAQAHEPGLDERLERVAREAKVLGVSLETEVAPGRGVPVAQRLLELVPDGATLVAGVRARPQNRALLAGTVSARLMAVAPFAVVAIRVVHPGVLGQPGRVLLPVAGRPGQAAAALPFLRLLGADLQRLDCLFVQEVSSLRLRLARRAHVERRLAEGRAVVAPIEAALASALAPHRFELDSTVVVSSDAAREIVWAARRHRSRLIALGASRRSRLERLAFGAPIERILRAAPADVAIYRSLE